MFKIWSDILHQFIFQVVNSNTYFILFSARQEVEIQFGGGGGFMGGVYMYFFHYSDIYLSQKWAVNNMEPSLIEHTTKSSQIK